MCGRVCNTVVYEAVVTGGVLIVGWVFVKKPGRSTAEATDAFNARGRHDTNRGKLCFLASMVKLSDEGLPQETQDAPEVQ